MASSIFNFLHLAGSRRISRSLLQVGAIVSALSKKLGDISKGIMKSSNLLHRLVDEKEGGGSPVWVLQVSRVFGLRDNSPIQLLEKSSKTGIFIHSPTSFICLCPWPGYTPWTSFIEARSCIDTTSKWEGTSNSVNIAVIICLATSSLVILLERCISFHTGCLIIHSSVT